MAPHIRSSRPSVGTVYEIGWQKAIVNGSCLCESGRRLYLFRDANKSPFLFLGEGPSQDRGKAGYGSSWRRSIDSVEVEWLPDRSAVPVRLHFVIKHWQNELFGGNNPDGNPRPDFETYREEVLAAPFPGSASTVDAPPFLVAKPEDTLDSLAALLAAWEPRNHGDKAAAFWRDELRRLNPQLHQSVLAAGTRVRYEDR